MVGVTGIEPATIGTQSRRSTKLSYTPKGPLNSERAKGAVAVASRPET